VFLFRRVYDVLVEKQKLFVFPLAAHPLSWSFGRQVDCCGVWKVPVSLFANAVPDLHVATQIENAQCFTLH